MSKNLNKRLFGVISSVNTKKVERLINLGANVNAINKDGDTPLLYACSLVGGGSCSVALHDLFNNSYLGLIDDEKEVIDIVNILIKNGADVNKGNPRTKLIPIYTTVITKCEKLTKILIQAGADVNLISGFRKRTPLMAAVIKGYTNIAHMLLMAGADASIKDSYGYTAFDLTDNKIMKAIISEFWLDADMRNIK